ncbi:MAG: ribonuclease III [Defluviitaleaceae bacterium]|nr:ribonuclease III [Defluviitaleaceae bacterium]
MEKKDLLMMDNGFGEAGEYSPLTLAWLGDAVLELLTRRGLCKVNAPVGKMFEKAKDFSSAAAQSQFYALLESGDVLSEDEKQIMKRGRNAKSGSRSKNAGVVSYRRATGVEALFGYLYVDNKLNRIIEIYDYLLGIHPIKG